MCLNDIMCFYAGVSFWWILAGVQVSDGWSNIGGGGGNFFEMSISTSEAFTHGTVLLG